MGESKTKGDIAELRVATDIARRGHRVAFPFGEDWRADLMVLRHGDLERIQVKHCRSDGEVLHVRSYSSTITAGKPVRVNKYTPDEVDWLAVWDATTDVCAYVPSSVFVGGRWSISLRLTPARNGQRRGVPMLQDFLEF